MKLACVVHRFGPDIPGGSEGHCRMVAEHLADRHDVTIVTTTAKDHVTWRNHYASGESRTGRLRIMRFPVARPRDLHWFKDVSDHVLNGDATPAEQEEWFRANGPESPALLEFLERQASQFDLVLFWAYRYYHSYFGVPLVGRRALLVPTAEADPLVNAEVVRQLFRLPAGYLLLTPEEADLLKDRIPAETPTCIIGCGVDPPSGSLPPRALDAGGRDGGGRYALYLGRIDPNKGCETLIRHFLRYVESTSAAVAGDIRLVLAGPANMPVPDHPNIRYMGAVNEATRDSLLAHASALVVPSQLESLSIVLLEAWNHGVPALVNADCAVLKGQIGRAEGGLHYSTAAEFASGLDYLLNHPDVASRLGAQGRAYVDREYRWPVVMSRLEAFLGSMASVSRS